MSEQNLGRLRELLFKEFNEGELAELCQDLGLSYDKLSGEGAFGKTRGLVEAAQARDLIPTLMSKVRDLRPTAYRIAGIRRYTQHPPTAVPATPSVAAGIPPVEAAKPPAEPPVATPEPATTETAVTEPATLPVANTVATPATVQADVPAPAPATAPMRTARSRIGWVAAIIVACLLLSTGGVALNQWLLAQRNVQTATGVNPAGTVDVAAAAATPPAATSTVTPVPLPTETAMPIPSATAIATIRATEMATAEPTATPAQPTSTAIPIVADTATPAPSATAPLSPSAQAIQSVLEANDLLAGFYSGKVASDTLRRSWAGDTFNFVVAYPTKTLKRSLNVDVKAGVDMTAAMRYMRQPSVVGDAGARTQLVSQEYWTYKVGDLVACETIDYFYIVSRATDHYQIIAYKGDVVSTLTGSGCE